MAIKRRTTGSIRRELIAAELDRLQKENAVLKAGNQRKRLLLWEFLSTHCAPLDLRERAADEVGKPPLEFGKETK